MRTATFLLVLLAVATPAWGQNGRRGVAREGAHSGDTYSGNHWSVNGDFDPSWQTLATHLSGTHGAGLPPGADLTTMSREQLWNFHDSDHEGRPYEGVIPAKLIPYDTPEASGWGRWEYRHAIENGKLVWKGTFWAQTKQAKPGKVKPPEQPPEKPKDPPVEPKPKPKPKPWPNVELPPRWPNI